MVFNGIVHRDDSNDRMAVVIREGCVFCIFAKLCILCGTKVLVDIVDSNICMIIFWFGLMLKVPVNSYGHVGVVKIILH